MRRRGLHNLQIKVGMISGSGGIGRGDKEVGTWYIFTLHFSHPSSSFICCCLFYLNHRSVIWFFSFTYLVFLLSYLLLFVFLSGFHLSKFLFCLLSLFILPFSFQSLSFPSFSSPPINIAYLRSYFSLCLCHFTLSTSSRILLFTLVPNSPSSPPPNQSASFT